MAVSRSWDEDRQLSPSVDGRQHRVRDPTIPAVHFSLLYFMINLDRVARMLHPLHPTPLTAFSAVAGGKVSGASRSPQDRNL